MILRVVLAVAYATGRASHARQVTGDDPDKKGYPGPPGWAFGVGLTTPPRKKKLIVTEVEQRKKLGRLNDDGRKKTRYTEITLAAWNVQTMLKPGRMKEIMEEIAKREFHSRTGRDEKKGKTQEKMERGSRKRSSSARSEKMERVGGR